MSTSFSSAMSTLRHQKNDDELNITSKITLISMIHTNNSCRILLTWIVIIILLPLIIVLLVATGIIYIIYNIVTCHLVCCNSMKNEFGDRFDTSAPHYNHTRGIFQNYWKSYEKLKWYENICLPHDFVSPKKPDYNSTDNDSKCALEYNPIKWDKIHSFNANKNDNKDKINYLWFGHSSCLIQVNGFNILTDPIFSDRCSASQWVGPKRYDNISKYRADIYKSLPIIDVIVISHDHYDHLDKITLITLNKLNKVRYFAVPLRIRKWLISHCKISENKIIELDWYYSAIINKKGFNSSEFGVKKEFGFNSHNSSQYYQNEYGNTGLLHNYDAKQEIKTEDENDNLVDGELKVICVPTQHFSGRTLFDQCYRLWCGWIIIGSNNKKIYFGGDTGCCSVPRKYTKTYRECDVSNKLECNPVFKEIGDYFNGIDLGLIPIGAYSPRYFMSRIHLNPFDACYVHKQIKSKQSIGIHWGSFYLTDEDYDEPPKVLRKAKQEYGINEEQFIVVKHGETIQV